MATSGYFTDEFPKDPGAPLKKDTIGTISGATWTTAGDAFDPNANVLSFDGIDDQIDYDSSKLNLKDVISPRTVSCWFQLDADGANNAQSQPLWCIPYFYAHVRLTTNQIQGRYDEASAQTVNGALLGTGDTNWHNFILTFIFDGTNYIMKGYTDGTLNETKSTTLIPTNNYSTSNRNRKIGIGGNGGQFKGQIKDVRIWNRALGADEVAEIYKGNNIYKNLIAWYRLDEGSGTEVQNYAGREPMEIGQPKIRSMFDEGKRLTDLSDREVARRTKEILKQGG